MMKPKSVLSSGDFSRFACLQEAHFQYLDSNLSRRINELVQSVTARLRFGSGHFLSSAELCASPDADEACCPPLWSRMPSSHV